MKKQVVTISREYGSGGREIGRLLAESMGVPFYDREKIDELTSGKGYSKEVLDKAEMKAKNSFLYNLTTALGGSGIEGSGIEGLSLNEKVFLAQFETIKKLASEGPCVIVGRCADYVLRDIPEATNIFIYAEPEDRIERAIKEYGIAPDEAKGWVAICDKARANYYAYHTGRKWGEHVNYSLSIDSGYIEIEDIVDLIVQYTKVRRFSQA